jgi:catechol 2,3-dioxygenase-like lactoylglutathione lyase family enzyme
MCVGDLPLIQAVVEQDPDALERRMSRFERGLPALHFAIARRRHDILALLLDLGADVNATDVAGQTAITAAMLAGDRDAIALLQAAGAALPAGRGAAATRTEMQQLAPSVRKGVPMIKVADVARALAWYSSIGFREVARFEDGGIVNFGILSFGGAELMLNMGGVAGRHDTSIWFYTDNVDAIYESLKSRQLAAAHAAMRGEPDADAVVFEQEIEDMFYGARQFCIRDPDGYELYFIQETAS